MWHLWETWKVHVGLVGKPEGKRERENVARMGDTEGACRGWWGNLRERERERESLWHVWETLEVHVGLVGKPEGKRERELVARMGDTGGACRVGGET